MAMITDLFSNSNSPNQPGPCFFLYRRPSTLPSERVSQINKNQIKSIKSMQLNNQYQGRALPEFAGVGYKGAKFV